MAWDHGTMLDVMHAPAQATSFVHAKARSRARWHLAAPRALAWKTLLLAVATLAFVPVLLWRSDMAGATYVAALVAVHIIGLGVLLRGSAGAWRSDRLLWTRIAGIVLLTVLLSLVGKGLTTTTGTIFWATLCLVWLLHTAGAVLLHLRGDSRACPFV